MYKIPFPFGIFCVKNSWFWKSGVGIKFGRVPKRAPSLRTKNIFYELFLVIYCSSVKHFCFEEKEKFSREEKVMTSFRRRKSASFDNIY